MILLTYRYFNHVRNVAKLTIIAVAACVSNAAAQSLAGSDWVFIKFTSSSDQIGIKRPKDPNAFTMVLNADGRVNMKLDCNRATGAYETETGASGTSGRFTFGPLAGTRALCRPPHLDQFIMSQVSFVRSYLLEGDMLHLSLMADGGVLTWQRQTAPEAHDVNAPKGPDQGGPRNWQVAAGSSGVNLRQFATTRAKVIAAYPTGTILDNLGCKTAEGRFWCDVQTLGGGLRGYVAADYLEPAVSPDGSIAYGYDDSALRAGQQQFDATGTLPCAEQPGQPTTACLFGVARSGGGYATVVIDRPSGLKRAVYFRMGQAIGADMSEADRWEGFSTRVENDLHFIRLGTERYEIPAAVIFGG
ncbi:META domain-containing protein [Pontibacter sp. JAM-7]|uniref:META domain-containing protein n=1 Tax=Pontibacter sp. JAM-7 TaxID=3366581 RepID=UPI003AF499DF